MSHTDKHRPVWVQLMDPENRGFAQEEHNHQDGICDLGDDPVAMYGWRRWSHCHISETMAAYNTGGMWPKMPRKGGWGRPRSRDGKARMRLRALRAEVLKVHRAGVPCWCGGCDSWVDQLPDWNEHKPTNAWLWWKSD
jgi:hypothetical protein